MLDDTLAEELVEVRRADLASRQSSVGTGSENVELEARFRQQVQHTHETSPQIGISAQGPSQDEGQSGQVVDEDPVEYDFRLFSKPAVSSRQEDSGKHIQKIALRSPTPDVSEPGFVTAQRPNNFYFTGAPSPCRVQKYSEIAISGEDVLRGLKIRHAGAELPWRVTVITTLADRRKSSAIAINKPATGKRGRIGKKRRIILRKKVAAEQEKQSAAQRTKIEKDEAEKEKRTRRNREKKAKKRQKDKINKVQSAQISP